MIIEELFHLEKLSVRSINLCRRIIELYKESELSSLERILFHYNKFKTFKNIRNCGAHSNDELIRFCLKFVDKEISESQRKENFYEQLTSSFSRTQREVVNSFIETNVNKLSNRSKNAIIVFLQENLKIQNVCERILSNDQFILSKINNVGAKSKVELAIFIKEIEEFTVKVSHFENENDLILIKNKYFIENTFSFSNIPEEIIDSSSIFTLVDFLINSGLIFEKKENLIFRKTLKIYRDQLEIGIDEMSIEIDLSRERIRQLKNNCLEKLFVNLQFIKNFEDNLFQKYNIDQNKPIIFIGDESNDFINSVNNTKFSKEFTAYIIYSKLAEKFDLIGRIEDVLQTRKINSRERHNWNNFYLVDRNVSEKFKFTDFVDDVNSRINERIFESYSLNFKSFIMGFSIDSNLDDLNIILEVAEEILNIEFGIYIDTYDDIRFVRNSNKQVFEYSYSALKSIGKPAKVDEIFKKITELHPEYETNESKIRSSLKRQHGFVPIGRRSIFGLKEWESELINFKGGTIRNIVIEFLNSELEPKHISEITKYVLKYRPKTYERSILDNLKADKTTSFVFYKNSTIGLRYKKYDESFVRNKKESTDSKSWEIRFEEFKEFVTKNSRIPKYTGCPYQETRLYRWFKLQERKMMSGNLNGNKSDLLNSVLVQMEKAELRNIK
jgi:hypothetical protein